MTIIGLTIFYVSMPTIGRDLHFSDSHLPWVSDRIRVSAGLFAARV